MVRNKNRADRQKVAIANMIQDLARMGCPCYFPDWFEEKHIAQCIEQTKTRLGNTKHNLSRGV